AQGEGFGNDLLYGSDVVCPWTTVAGRGKPIRDGWQFRGFDWAGAIGGFGRGGDLSEGTYWAAPHDRVRPGACGGPGSQRHLAARLPMGRAGGERAVCVLVCLRGSLYGYGKKDSAPGECYENAGHLAAGGDGCKPAD